MEKFNKLSYQVLIKPGPFLPYQLKIDAFEGTLMIKRIPLSPVYSTLLLFLGWGDMQAKAQTIHPMHQNIAHTGDSIIVQKHFSRKKNRVKLYPDAGHEVLFFSASGKEGKVYQLFLFDMGGKLIKQVNVKSKQTTLVQNIEKGIYQFEVFSDDERIENGRVLVL